MKRVVTMKKKAEELMHKAVYEICEDIIQHPRIVEVSTLQVSFDK